MAQTTAQTSEGTPSVTAQVEHAEHEHPSEWKYIQVAAFLAAITAVEVALSYIEVGNQAATNALLVIGSVIKFATVALYFMHLKFDSRVLRRFFIAGIALAALCYIGYLWTLGVSIL